MPPLVMDVVPRCWRVLKDVSECLRKSLGSGDIVPLISGISWWVKMLSCVGDDPECSVTFIRRKPNAF